MSNFCGYPAYGDRMKLDKNGEKTKEVAKSYEAHGVAKNDCHLYGSIMRQNPDFLACDRMTVFTYQL